MKYITYLFLFVSSLSLAQEDSINQVQECYAPTENFFVNPTQHQLFENPAAAGLYRTNNVHVSATLQEFNTPWFTKSYQFSLDRHLGKSKKWGIGCLYRKKNDADIFVQTNLGVSLSRLFQQNSHQITLGLSASYKQLSLDWTQLTFGDMIDPRRGFIYQSNTSPRHGPPSNIVFDLGIVYKFKEKLRIGLAINDPTQANLSILNGYAGVATTFNANASYEFSVNPDLKIIPILKYEHYSVFSDIEGKAMVTLGNRYMFSLGYNNNKRASAMLGYNLKNKLIGMIEYNHGLYPGIGDFIYHTPTVSGKLFYRFNLKK